MFLLVKAPGLQSLVTEVRTGYDRGTGPESWRRMCQQLPVGVPELRMPTEPELNAEGWSWGHQAHGATAGHCGLCMSE